MFCLFSVMFEIIKIFGTENDEKQFYCYLTTKSIMNLTSIESEQYVKRNKINTRN